MASIFDDLGAMFAPSQPQPAQGEAASTAKSQWDSWLSDPANRAGLLSFGLQALAGGHGSFGQQLAGALSNGIAGMQGYEALKHQREQEDIATAQRGQHLATEQDKLASTERIHAADRASREKIAGMYTDQRLATASMKQDMKPLVQQEYMKAYNTVHAKMADPIARSLAGLPDDPAQAQAMVESMAKRAGDAAANAFEARFGGQSAPETSAKPAGAAPSGGNAPQNSSQISPGLQSAPATAGKKPTLNQLLANPQFAATVQQALQNPAGRQVLRNKVADPKSIDVFEPSTANTDAASGIE